MGRKRNEKANEEENSEDEAVESKITVKTIQTSHVLRVLNI